LVEIHGLRRLGIEVQIGTEHGFHVPFFATVLFKEGRRVIRWRTLEFVGA
jgi:hypothetical protein